MPAQGTALLFDFPTNHGDGGPHAVENGVAPSSFGMEATTLGPEYAAAGIWNSQRRAELLFREKYWKCTQHDWKTHNFNGQMIPSGRRSMVQPLLSTNAATPNYWVPMSSRRPSNPYRLGRKIVGSFTNMLFSHGRFPQMRSADPDTQDWAEQLTKAADLMVEMIRARGLGGSCGVVGIWWGWVDGKPQVKPYEGRDLHVLQWKDEAAGLPSHVTKLDVIQKTVLGKNGKPELKNFWQRRDWTEQADVVFFDAEIPKDNAEPPWHTLIDEELSVVHGHGRIHFEWVANVPDDESESTDGQPDYPETYEQMDVLDQINSVVARGAIANLDPTLVLGMDPETLEGAAVSKGSENALITGQGGTATYLEISGSSISAGISLLDKFRDQILETCECVLTDPDKAAASGQSSVALKIIYAPMIAKCDVMRGTYGGALERMMNGLTDYARKFLPDLPGQQVLVEDLSVDVELDEEGNEIPRADIEVQFFVDLPPREETVEVIGLDGLPTGELTVEVTERKPGKGQIALEWGEYFKPTADDIQKQVTTLGAATGSKAVLSQRTAVELTANLYDRDPNREWVEVVKQTQDDKKHELSVNAGVFPGAGGEVVTETGEVEGNADALPNNITDTVRGTLTVNELRKSMGKAPLMNEDGTEDEDGLMPVAEFNAKMTALGTAEGNVQAGLPPGGAPAPGGF